MYHEYHNRLNRSCGALDLNDGSDYDYDGHY